MLVGPACTISVDVERASVRMSTAMMRTPHAVGLILGLVLGSSPAFACHVDGTVYCDENANGVIDASDTPLPGITVGATSLDLMSGQYFATTDASGNYDIPLPSQTDHYSVALENLPGGQTVVVPAGGSYTIDIIVNTSQDHVDGANFLVQGCGSATTSTTTTSPSSTTTSTTLPSLYQCYEVDHATFSLPGASLSNQFGASTADVSTPKRLCNPADFNGTDPAALNDPAHLVGYTLVHTSPPFVPVNGLSVTNALGTFVVDVVRPARLFVPSAKSLSSPPPPLSPASAPDHFECYRAKGGRLASALQLTMQDEFGTQRETILKFEQLCVPVSLNGSGIRNPTLKLMCYRSKYTGARFRGPGGPAFVNNEFGPATLQASHGEELCLPSS
jgi:hypothetical protein